MLDFGQIPNFASTKVFRVSVNTHPPALHSSLIFPRIVVTIESISSLVIFPVRFPRDESKFVSLRVK